MQFTDFKRIVTCFADRIDDVDVNRGELLVQIRDETIAARLHQRPEGLLVEEHGERRPAVVWIVNRLARIPLLAERICSYVVPPEHFVPPSGRFLDQPDNSGSDKDTSLSNAAQAMAQVLDRRPGGTTSVLYLTSNAGEGKTSLINHVAVQQAEAYKAKQSDWLLVPVPLGGGGFLRFDDVVVAALVNKLRFQLLYYDAFLELVRLGVLIPAFDGFEEMIVESSSGEALSALGGLAGRLGSAGTLLVSARRAYFDYPNFGAQARLFDTIGSDGNVVFGRLSLNRWERQTFKAYASKRQVGDPSGLYDHVSERLRPAHPVLTRAVMVRRLVDAALVEGDLAALLKRIDQHQTDYFRGFVDGVVEREAFRKWVDRSGDGSGALLTAEEHHQLLASIAHEMWLSSTDELGVDVVSLLVEMFAEVHDKGPVVARQIQERITEHALLTASALGRPALTFDHEDFRVFYLGFALALALLAGDAAAVRSTIDQASLPEQAVVGAAGHVRQRGREDCADVRKLLQELAEAASAVSFVRENCGALMLFLLDGDQGASEVRSMGFPAGALRNRRLSDVRVSGSYFQATSLIHTELRRCSFHDCQFARLEIDGSENVDSTSFDGASRVEAVVLLRPDDEQVTLFDPVSIRRALADAGFDTPETAAGDRGSEPKAEDQEELVLVQRFLRPFLRATALNESTIRQRLGISASRFMKELLPQLEQAMVIKEVAYKGSGSQRRWRLVAPMARIEDAMKNSDGEFVRFLRKVQEQSG